MDNNPDNRIIVHTTKDISCRDKQWRKQYKYIRKWNSDHENHTESNTLQRPRNT